MKRESRREHNPVKTRSEEAQTIASNLAPLEEQESREGSPQHPNGRILLDTGELKLPKDFIEEDRQADGSGLDRVLIFLLVIVLGFIAFIAYLISIEPPK
jgi:hypothetical protein